MNGQPHTSRYSLTAPALLTLVAALVCVSGCGDSSPPNAPVTGRVVVTGGIPLSAGNLILLPADGSLDVQLPGALIRPDGSFECYSTSGGEGIPPGDYKVLLSFSGSGIADGPSLHRAFTKYTKAETTPLRVTVPPGGVSDVVLEVEDAAAAEEQQTAGDDAGAEADDQ